MKKIKLVKRGMAAFLLLMLILAQVVGVQAAGESATLKIIGNPGQSLVGKKLQLHRLFDAENSKGLESINYTMNPVYASALQAAVGSMRNKSADAVTEYEIIDYMQSMNETSVQSVDVETEPVGRYSDYRYFVEKLAAEMEHRNLTGELIEVTSVDEQGNFEITGLTYGYYMVLDVTEGEGKHTAISMPLLSTANPNAAIRIKADYPVVVEKILEDAGGLWNDIGDYEIGQDVTYRYQSHIPDINGYHSYYYAWHTQSEEALSLKPDTIQILIEDYQLTSKEYQLIQDVSTSAFTIEIADIKAIVDREFPDQAYNQQVTVTYQSTLNEKAALDTGRPGFENDVQLEFSNNPNAGGEAETGLTAQDTVVCFTYQLSGKKLNNYGTNLEGAAFRLYADEACEQEILLQKVGDRYHVMHEDILDDDKRALATDVLSDADGNFLISGLDSDTYYLKETEAPQGYRPLLDPIRIQVQAEFPKDRDAYIKGEGATEGILTLSATAYMKSFVHGEEVEKELELEVEQEEGSIALAVVNEVGSVLPKSGSYAILIIGGVCIILFVIATVQRKKKHE